MKTGVDDYLANGNSAENLEGLPRHAFAVPSSAMEGWPELAPEALYGLPGRIVRALTPYTEGDPAAVLIGLLAGMGNLIGPGAYTLVGQERHPCRIFAALVGASGRARKGTAWVMPKYLLGQVDEEWHRRRIGSGLSSGEGLISVVRDPRVEMRPVRVKGRVEEYEEVIEDHGEADKRFLAVENEFAVVLKRMQGDGNSVSGLLRQAWESGNLSTITKSPLRATGAHISMLAHITVSELRRYLTETERANGFANRFLWLLVRRHALLPDGANPPDPLLAPFVAALQEVQRFGRVERWIERDAAATAMWRRVYGPLSNGQCTGNELLDAVTSRADAQVLRLSLLYAVFDSSPAIRAEHLKAALAIWKYAEASAYLIFAGMAGDRVQDAILEALRLRGPLTRTDISALFARNLDAARTDGALKALEMRGLIRRLPSPADGRGRPPETWELVPRSTA